MTNTTREALKQAMDSAFEETVPTYAHENAPHPYDIGRANMGGFEYDRFQDAFLEKAGDILAAANAEQVQQPQEEDRDETDWSDAPLNACPRCRRPAYRDEYMRSDSSDMVIIKCGSCGFHGAEHFYNGMERAVTEWNAIPVAANAAEAKPEPVAYTSPDRLEKLATVDECSVTMWTESIRHPGDVPLYAALPAPMDAQPIGYIDRKDIARLSNYKVTIWPGTNEIDAVAVYLAAQPERDADD